jgi:hypothetical protein
LLEDKIVQRAVAEVLNAVYEADFLGFSYGTPQLDLHHIFLVPGVTADGHQSRLAGETRSPT